MRPLIASLLLGMSLSASAFAIAAETASGFAPIAVEDYVGEYGLSDGRYLTITERNGTLRAFIGPHHLTQRRDAWSHPGSVPLKQDGPTHFVSPSTPLQISFAPEPDGYVESLLLTEGATSAPVVARR